MRLNHLKSGLVLLAALSLNHLVHAGELTVIEQDYELAQKEAVRQNKLLLIDFYTVWCGPCKELDAAVFRDTAVSRRIAGNFVLLRYDAEKDMVHRLSLKHHVSMYPTTLILNRDQRVVHRQYGMVPGKDPVTSYLEFLEEARAKAANDHFIKGYSKAMDLVYPKFYEDFVFRINTRDVDSKIAAYWQSATDYLSEVPFTVLCYFSGGTDEVNEFLIANRRQYEELYGELDVRFIITMMISRKLFDAMTARDRPAFDAGILFAREHLDPENAATYLPFMEERMLQVEGRWPEALKLFGVRRDEQRLGDDETARFCRSAADDCTEPAVLRTCRDWMKTIVDKSPAYRHLDTYARLLFRTGDKKKGYTYMERAIAAGQLAKEDTTDSENWLKECRK